MNNHWIQTVVAVFIIFFSFNAQALNCEEKSPQLIQQGDEYYNFEENIPLTRQQIKSIETMFSDLNRRLEGSSVVIECINKNGSFEQIVKVQEIKANVKVESDGKIVMTLSAYLPSERRGFEEVIEYLNSNSTYILKELTANQMQVISRYRRVNGAGTSSLHEIVADISVNKDALSIQSTLFINGYFGLSRSFQLQ